jgi:septum formation protein
VVVARDGRPIWRVVESAKLSVRPFSDAWLDGYLERNAARHAVVGRLLRAGERRRADVRRIDGDYFTILGLP